MIQRHNEGIQDAQLREQRNIPTTVVYLDYTKSWRLYTQCYGQYEANEWLFGSLMSAVLGFRKSISTQSRLIWQITVRYK
jgi:hypothetical protein